MSTGCLNSVGVGKFNLFLFALHEFLNEISILEHVIRSNIPYSLKLESGNDIVFK